MIRSKTSTQREGSKPSTAFFNCGASVATSLMSESRSDSSKENLAVISIGSVILLCEKSICSLPIGEFKATTLPFLRQEKNASMP